LEECFKTYFARLDTLPKNTGTEFEKIQNLITRHFDIVEDMSDEIYIVMSACPAKLRDPRDNCAKNIHKQRTWLTTYLTICIEKGILKGEFSKIPVEATVNIMIALINGIMRRRSMKLEQAEGMKEATIDFRRRSLLK
jgi:hypothetical protein